MGGPGSVQKGLQHPGLADKYPSEQGLRGEDREVRAGADAYSNEWWLLLLCCFFSLLQLDS